MKSLLPYLMMFALGMYVGMAFLAFWVARRERANEPTPHTPNLNCRCTITPISWSAPRAAPRIARVTAAAIAELRDADRRVPS